MLKYFNKTKYDQPKKKKRKSKSKTNPNKVVELSATSSIRLSCKIKVTFSLFSRASQIVGYGSLKI